MSSSPTGGGAGDFYQVAPAVAARRRESLTVVVFDVLWLDGRLVIDETYEERRARLDALDLGPVVTTVQNWGGITAPWKGCSASTGTSRREPRGCGVLHVVRTLAAPPSRLRRRLRPRRP